MPTLHLSRIRAITVSTLIGGGALSACAPELNWREVRPVDADGLVAWFPCKPDAVSRRLSWPGVSQALVHVLSCRSGGALWALRYTQVPDAPQVTPTLAGWSQDLTGRVGYLAVPAPPIHVPGMTSQVDALAWVLTREASAPAPSSLPTQAVAWHFSHGKTVFQASVWTMKPVGTVSKGDDAVQTFKNGLQFPG